MWVIWSPVVQLTSTNTALQDHACLYLTVTSHTVTALYSSLRSCGIGLTPVGADPEMGADLKWVQRAEWQELSFQLGTLSPP